MTTKREKIKVRRWQAEDIPGIVKCHRAAYPDYPEDGGHYNERSYRLQFQAFPEGQFLAELNGQVVGYATSLIVQLDDDTPYTYTYSEITGAGTFSTHTPSGDTLYGADIAVHPAYRRQGIAKLLYQQRKKLIKRYNLRRTIAYGRIPGYGDYAGKLTAEEYVRAVEAGQIEDSALNMHLLTGYQVKKVLIDFVWDDSSLNYSTLLELPNPDYKPERRKIAAVPLHRPVRKIRVCAAQYLMRPIDSWDEFERSVEFFVETADTYHCHFLLLPELFTAQLFCTMPRIWSSQQTMHELANLTDRYLEMFTKLAVEHNLYIIGGSQPVRRDNSLYNVAHLFTPTGHIYTQDKLHITPGERKEWDSGRATG